jgi:hypothetical protein
MAYEIGTKISVEFDGTVGTREGENATTRVEEKGFGSVHYIYLNSEFVTGAKVPGGSVHVKFTATITGEREAGASITTQVKEIRDDERLSPSFTHFVYLGSDRVTEATEEEKPVTEEEKPTAAIRATGPIKNTDYQVDSADVLKRIAELEESNRTLRYRITRNRNGVIFTSELETSEAARQYLDERDFQPDRFTVDAYQVTVRSLGDSDQNELTALRSLNRDGKASFGSFRWVTDNVRLHARSYFDSAWARDRAQTVLGIGPSEQLDEWPLSLIRDWEYAARQLRDREYTAVLYDGVYYWGCDSTDPDTA